MATNLLIVVLGGDKVGSNLGGLDTGLQSSLGTLDSIVGAVEVPSDTANRSSADTGPEKGIRRAFGCLGRIFSETGGSESGNLVRGGGTSSQTGRGAERRANSRGEHCGQETLVLRVAKPLKTPIILLAALNRSPSALHVECHVRSLVNRAH